MSAKHVLRPKSHQRSLSYALNTVADRPALPQCVTMTGVLGVASLRCSHNAQRVEESAWAELRAFLTTPVVVEVLQHWCKFSVLFLVCSSREMTSPTRRLKSSSFEPHRAKGVKTLQSCEAVLLNLAEKE